MCDVSNLRLADSRTERRSLLRAPWGHTTLAEVVSEICTRAFSMSAHAGNSDGHTRNITACMVVELSLQKAFHTRRTSPLRYPFMMHAQIQSSACPRLSPGLVNQSPYSLGTSTQCIFHHHIKVGCDQQEDGGLCLFMQLSPR